MKIVEPIRDKTQLERLKIELQKRNFRDYMLFLTGLNSGMRVSDVVSLNRDDVRNKDGTMKQYITVVEKKTKKIKKFPLCNNLLIEMEKYTRDMEENQYLFQSRKGINKPISTTQAYRIISSAAKKINLTNIGTHSMRKSFGYHHYLQFHDVALLMEILNHSNVSTTLRYIGIQQDEIDLGYKQFSL